MLLGVEFGVDLLPPAGDTPMALTDAKVRTAKPLEKPYKLSDERGLFLLVASNGSKYWRFKYRFAGKEKLLAFGVYPDVSLTEAREKRDAARKLLTNETDPGLVKQLTKHHTKLAHENTFQTIALEWLAKFSSKWEPGYSEKVSRRLETNLFPWLGSRPIAEITAPELLVALRRIEARGAIDTAHRTRQYCTQIFRYAIATGRAERDPAADLQGALPPRKKNHYASITDPKAVGDLLRAIQGYQGYFVTKCALELAPLLFVRPGELRFAEWSEINFEIAEWRIPAARMKMRDPHIVPLSTQALAILSDLKALTRHSKYLFPGIRTNTRPISENTVNAALRRLGYTKEEMTGHGFRSMASTLLNEQGWHRDAIERQLSHSERNSVRAAYNYAEYLPERRKMMQHWADYLCSLVTRS